MIIDKLAAWPGCGPLAVRLEGAAVDGRLSCRINASHYDRYGRFFPVSCVGVTTTGASVQLTGTHAGIGGESNQFLSGPWSLRIGAQTHRLACLASDWRAARPCGARSGYVHPSPPD
jgi:hypothetical protein